MYFTWQNQYNETYTLSQSEQKWQPITIPQNRRNLLCNLLRNLKLVRLHTRNMADGGEKREDKDQSNRVTYPFWCKLSSHVRQFRSNILLVSWKYLNLYYLYFFAHSPITAFSLNGSHEIRVHENLAVEVYSVSILRIILRTT